MPLVQKKPTGHASHSAWLVRLARVPRLPGAHGMKVAGRPAHPAAGAALVRSAALTLPGQGSSSSVASHGAGWQVPAGLGMSIAEEKKRRPPIRLCIVTQVRT